MVYQFDFWSGHEFVVGLCAGAGDKFNFSIADFGGWFWGKGAVVFIFFRTFGDSGGKNITGVFFYGGDDSVDVFAGRTDDAVVGVL